MATSAAIGIKMEDGSVRAVRLNRDGYVAYAKTRTPVFGSSFAELAAAFMTDRQRKQLRKLIDFRFTRDRNYNLPAWRLKKLEAFLQRRIEKR